MFGTSTATPSRRRQGGAKIPSDLLLQYIKGINDGGAPRNLPDTLGSGKLLDQTANEYNMDLMQSGVIHFGGASYADVGLAIDSSTVIEILLQKKDNVVSTYMGGFDDTDTDHFGIENTNGGYLLTCGTKGGGVVLSAIPVGGWLKMKIDASDGSAYIDLLDGNGYISAGSAGGPLDTGKDWSNFFLGDASISDASDGSGMNGCVAWFKMSNATSSVEYVCGEISGPILYDVSGNSNDAVLQDGAEGIETMRALRGDYAHPNAINGCSKAIYFNGVDSCGTSAEVFNPVVAFDMSVAIRSDSTSALIQGILYAGLSGANTSTSLYVVQFGATLYVSVNGGALAGTPSSIILDGKWHTIRIVSAGSGQAFTVDIDGVTKINGTCGTRGVLTDVLRLGSQYDAGAPLNYFSGAMQDITLVGGFDLQTRNMSDGLLPDAVGSNDVTLTNVTPLFIPALADGSGLDVNGETLTNPPIQKGVAHNGCETLYQVEDGASADLGHVEMLYAQEDEYGDLPINQLDSGWVDNLDGTYSQTAEGTFRRLGYNPNKLGVTYKVTATIISQSAGAGIRVVIGGAVGSTITGAGSSITEEFSGSFDSGAGIQSYGDFVGTVSLSVEELLYETGDRRQISYDYFKTWISGTDNCWLGRASVDGTCCVTGWAIYDSARAFTPAEYTQLTNAFPNTCGGLGPFSVSGGGQLIPAEVTEGTGIGPTSSWADNGNGEVLLVENA